MATQTGRGEALIDLLNDLIQLDYDAIEAYDAAIERLGDARDQEHFRNFRGDHHRHTVDLAAAIRNLGGKPATGADIKRVLTKGRVVLAGLSGDDAILHAMKSNEDVTNREYEKALQFQGLGSAERELLDRNLGDERRHRAWIEQRLAQFRPTEAPRY